MNAHPLYNNAFDYRGIASAINPTTSSSLLNVVKPKAGLLSKLTGSFSLSKVGTIIGNTQKVLRIYNQVSPIIKQTRPLINNLKTTFKVAKAFKRFSKDDSLEKAFDNLPDYEEEKPKNKIDEENIIDIKEEKKINPLDFIDIVEVKDDKTIPNPFIVVI